jgi:hypothetical protein
MTRGNILHSVSIHILDDYSLLNIFYVYRPFILHEDEDDGYRLSGRSSRWDLEHWWIKLTHGTPVMDMITHSPPLPLVIDYLDDITTDEEGGIMFALEQRDRVRRIRLQLPISKLQKFITITEEYPILENLIMGPSIKDNSSVLMMPETRQAPHLRHLSLTGFALPIGSRLLTTATGLVTLSLKINHPSTYFQPNALLQWLSFMPLLETLMIVVVPVRNLGVERHPTRMPITRLTLPNLRCFGFRGVSVYVEEVFHRITTPRLEKLRISFFNELIFSVPHLRQFISRTESLSFASARFNFSNEEVCAEVYPREETEKYALQIRVLCSHLDWQLSAVAQIFNSLSQTFSAVENLSVINKHSRSTEDYVADHRDRHELFKLFSNLKTLYDNHGLLLAPPLLHSPPHPQVYTPSPIPQAYSLPFIQPRPLTPGVYIHPALAAPSLRYAVRFQPSHSNPHLSPPVLSTPASYPPLPSLALRVGALPWLFTVFPDSRHSSGNAFVTVQDVLVAIYYHLRKAAKGDEYEAMSKARKRDIFRAFESRVGTDAVQRGKGLRRIDFLGGRFRAQGLVRAQSKDSVWDVVIY